MGLRTQSEGSLNYDEFTTLMKKILDLAWGKNWGTFTSDAPSGNDPTTIEFPIITYSLKHLSPGEVGKGVKEIRARQRFFDSMDLDGTQPSGMIIKGQVFDAEVVFELWEESNSKVEKLAKDFRDFMTVYSGYFKQKGLRNILFLMMNDKSESGKFRDNTVCRKFIYKLQFEEFTEYPTDIFKSIETRLKSLDAK